MVSRKRFSVSVVNEHRRRQLTELMADRGWDSILLYGNGWRKDYFRSLVNFNYSGPYAAAYLSRSGALAIFVNDLFDSESLYLEAATYPAQDFADAQWRASAIAGLELMEQRFVTGSPVSATADVEELRRIKTPEEIGWLQEAASLADRGYQCFADTVKVGIREYELVAEVEGFLKSQGAEDNFMLIASGGTEVVGMKPPTDRKLVRGDS